MKKITITNVPNTVDDLLEVVCGIGAQMGLNVTCDQISDVNRSRPNKHIAVGPEQRGDQLQPPGSSGNTTPTATNSFIFCKY